MKAPSIRADRCLNFSDVFISDWHFPKDLAQAEKLLEFLCHVNCKRLFIVGDSFDGWFLKRKKHRKFSEMQMRVMDRINYMAANGTEVIMLPGNHDEDLRGQWNFKQHKITKATDKHPSLLDQKHVFTDALTGYNSSIYLTDSYEFIDGKSRKILVMHGDQFHPASLKTKWGKRLSDRSDDGYDLLVKIDRHLLSKLAGESDHFSISGYAKNKAKKSFKIVEAFQQAAIDAVRSGKANGLLCGDLHHPELRDDEDVFYLNTGDWIENCSAGVHEDGNWKLLKWDEERQKLGLTALPTEEDPNLYQAYRGVTELQLRWVQRIWPARNLDDKLQEISDSLKKLGKLKRKFREGGGDESLLKKYKKAQRNYEEACYEAMPY